MVFSGIATFLQGDPCILK